MAAVLDETANRIIAHDENLSFFDAIPWVSLQNKQQIGNIYWIIY